MRGKLNIIIFIVFTVSFSQSQVSISGTVQDSRTKTPVNDASVKLLVMNITAVTDAEGKFSPAPKDSTKSSR